MLLTEIVLCSKFLRTKFITYKCFGMRFMADRTGRHGSCAPAAPHRPRPSALLLTYFNFSQVPLTARVLSQVPGPGSIFSATWCRRSASWFKVKCYALKGGGGSKCVWVGQVVGEAACGNLSTEHDKAPRGMRSRIESTQNRDPQIRMEIESQQSRKIWIKPKPGPPNRIKSMPGSPNKGGNITSFLFPRRLHLARDLHHTLISQNVLIEWFEKLHSTVNSLFPITNQKNEGFVWELTF